MADYHLSSKAVEDLNGIWNYTLDTWSEKQADVYYRMLLKECEKISKNPDDGRKYDGISQQLLGVKASRHIIFYRKISKDGIEVFRILHEMMDLKKRIED